MINNQHHKEKDVQGRSCKEKQYNQSVKKGKGKCQEKATQTNQRKLLRKANNKTNNNN